MAKMQLTTQAVVARPTASAPPRAFNPLVTEMNTMSQEKVRDFISACQTYFKGIASRSSVRKLEAER